MALPEGFLSAAGLREGDQVLLLPLGEGLLYLQKVDTSELLSRESLSVLMRTAFERIGCTTREQVLALIQEVKQELAQEW